jgi:FlaA1/EpsC-like NDP-sugar epimerase
MRDHSRILVTGAGGFIGHHLTSDGAREKSPEENIQSKAIPGNGLW